MMLEQLIADNTNLVYALAHKFQNYSDKEDLYQVGKLGLVKAYKNFDKEKGVKFTTYAFPYVLGEMKKLVRENRGYKVGKEIRKLNLKIEKAYILLSQKLMREPSVKELSLYLEMDEYLIGQAIRSNYMIKSIEEPVNMDGKALTLNDLVKDNSIMDNDTLIALKYCLESLDDDERVLIENRYFDDLTQREIASNLGISQVQVSRMEQKVLKKMRQNF